MEDENKAVEESGSAAPDTSGADDAEATKLELEATQALLKTTEEERDNARKDVIAIKTGKKRNEVDLSAPPKPQQANEQAPQPDLTAQLAEKDRVIAELARGMSARANAPIGGASQAESPAPKPQGYWSPEQRGELKKRGWSDDKIAKAEHTAQTGTAAAEKELSNAQNPARRY